MERDHRQEMARETVHARMRGEVKASGERVLEGTVLERLERTGPCLFLDATCPEVHCLHRREVDWRALCAFTPDGERVAPICPRF